jgi:hypothetical protein
MRRTFALIAAAALAACGSNNTGSNVAVARNSAGTGSSTLLVQGDINASTVNGSPLTTFSVTVRDGAGATVGGATVTVSNPSLTGGSIALTQVIAGTGPYVGTVASFPTGDFRLDVVKGTDNVQGVVVGGVGMQTINAPAAGATVAANQDLPVTWTTPAIAKSFAISTKDMAFSGPDLGAYTIAAAQNPTRLNGGQRIRLDRTNEVEAAGGLPGSGTQAGSRLRVTYTATVDSFTVQ